MLSILGGFSRALFACQTARCVVLLSTNMNTRMLTLYEEAVYALNGLQSNAATLQKSRSERDVNAYRNLTDTEKHLKTLGIEVSDLDSLNVIHVSGTKGKGSTCAFVESILRKHGYKTGFYSSPHLVSVNERIRINGAPIDKNLFTKYFWEVYKPLQHSLKNGEMMPPYFMFLTVMAFYIFIKEKIEAAVIEVGIGGLYDCTNIIKKPVVVAVTSLGIDHVSLLGHSVAEIAVHKAGIFKSGVPALTVPQPESAMKVLFDKAKDVNCPLKIAPPLEIYNKDVQLGVPGVVQSTNASLALQLAAVWLENHSSNTIDEKNIKNEYDSRRESFIPMAVTFPINSKFKEGLKSCIWPGRCQIIEKKGLTFYLDGAHTQQSISHCIKWFEDTSEKQRIQLQSPVLRILLFNCTGERKAENLLNPLCDVNFDFVIFCPNRKSVMKDSSSDLSNFMIDPHQEIEQCNINKKIWCHLRTGVMEDSLNLAHSSSPVLQHKVRETVLKENNILQFCCLSNAVDWLLHKKSFNHCFLCDKSEVFTHFLKESPHIQVLVTGSLHLVGGVLGLIEP